jgi:dipeptidyl-peptidase-4
MNKFLLYVLFAASIPGAAVAQDRKVQETPNYQLAARFAPSKVSKLVFSTSVNPNWMRDGNKFWYSYSTPAGVRYYIVDPVAKKKELMFDNGQLAMQITRIVKDPFDAQHLGIRNLKFTEDEKKIRFEVNSTKDTLKSKEERERGNRNDSLTKKVFLLEYDLATKKLVEIIDTAKKPKPHLSWASFNPDSTIVFFAKNYNLYWMDRANYNKLYENEKDSTVVEHQITTDGVEHYAWGGGGRGGAGGGMMGRGGNEDPEKRRYRVGFTWSPDGKHFIMTRKDNRHIEDLWVINNVGGRRPTLETYKYQMPGEPDSTEQELYIFNIDEKKPKQVNVFAFKNQTLSLWGASRPKNAQAGDPWINTWLGDNDKFYFARSSRDLKRIDIGTISTSGEVKVLVEERFNTYMDVNRPYLINGGKELVVWSQRDGWGHFYLYDGNGKLKNQITSGEFYSSEITGVDEATRTLYFIANGREKDEDPYFKHHYSVKLDGSGLRLLNPGDFNHNSNMSESKRFFVNNYSRVNTVPESALYNSNGEKVMHLETADLSLLFAAGYKFPEPFKVKSDDGVTDIYGVMYKPYDFDSTKVYPLVQYVYPGPQTEAVEKSFTRVSDRTDRLAQMGFVVITVGNRGGHPERSKWYHNYGYGDLRDYGLADKKAAAEQLADRHSFIDINRVGITGHSGGGFMSTAAMLVYPDFFKVAVSGAGNHENNIYNRWWSERHHGVKEQVNAKGDTTFSYSIDRNSALAANLKGKLMLVTGDIDNNVHPAGTIRMAEALIKANKRFEFVIMPGQRHGFGNMSEYFFWKMSDYFAQHLLGSSKMDETDIVEMNREIARKR